MAGAGRGYSNLEFDLGGRGSEVPDTFIVSIS